MKKTTVIVIIGAVAIGGLALASISNWGEDFVSSEPTEKNDTTVLTTDENPVNKEVATNTSHSPYNIGLYINQQPHSIEMLENGFGEPQLIQNDGTVEVVETEKYFTTSLMPKEVFNALPISENMIFYTGLQSNTNPDLWLYTERNMDNMDYNVRLYNTSTKEAKTFFGQKNSPNDKYAFKPFAINNDNSVVYLEALVFGSHTEHEEVWVLDLETESIKELNVHQYYVSTPTLSPDGKFLLYTAASQQNDLHVPANQLFIYDLNTNKESQIISDRKLFISQPGWIKNK